MGTLTWLHLSDIHFRPQSEWKDATARTALLEHLKAERAKHRLDIDLVFCTGDIAFGELRDQPLHDQYALAEQFFDELLAICGRDGKPLARDRLFVVPGNHDVDRDAVDPAAQASWTRWGSPGEARQQRDDIEKNFAGLKSPVASAMRRLDAYGTFAARVLPHQQPAAGHHHFALRREINGVNIGIGGFNSAWTCHGDSDDRTLWLGAEPQFNAMRAALAPARLRIGLIHHPHDWFNEAERSVIRDRAEYDFDFWLHGHTHDLRVHDAANLVTVGAGALTGECNEEYGYNIVRLDTQSGVGTAYLYHRDGNRSDWKPFTIAKVAEPGWQTFRLPGHSGAPAEPVASGQDFAPPQLRRDPALPPQTACLERSAELSKLAAWSVQTPPVPVLICGYGGLGKTEIAVRYLHSEEARQHFGAQRYFLSVEGLEATPTPDLPGRFWAGVARALFGRKAPPASADDLLDELRGALTAQTRPALLLLDNFETVVLIDPHFAVAALEGLGALAAQGLTLHVTLREPLPNLRARVERLPLLPLADRSAMRRLFCHWMHADPDAILVPDDAAALDHLLTLAEGWPIQLQMLGVAAEIEGLRALAQRCANAAEMAALMAAQDEPDRHRHSHLSCRITYESPQLGDAGRRLLRCLACFADGVPEDWLPDWPEPAALRELRKFKLLLEALGRGGEARCKLPAPLRDYLRHAHPVADGDVPSLVQAWEAWWRRVAPELFDADLPRRTPAEYRDLYEREFGSILGLALAKVDRGRLGRALIDALWELAGWVGDVSDWAVWLAELRRVVEQATWLFGTAERARRYARLLAGSHSLGAADKKHIAGLIRQHCCDQDMINGLERILLKDMDRLAWTYGSHDLADSLSAHLADGRACLQASTGDLLRDFDAIGSADERIALLALAPNACRTGEDGERLQAARDTALSEPKSALACYLRSKPGESDGLRAAVKLQPDYGAAWYRLARSLPADDARTAWQQVRRCAEAHLSETQRRGWSASPRPYGALARLQQACAVLGDQAASLAALDARTQATDESDTVELHLQLANDYLAADRIDPAAELGRRAASARSFRDEDAEPIRAFARSLFLRAPQHALAIVERVFARREDTADLATAADMLFSAGLPSVAYAFCRAAANAGLGASQANDLAYALLTRGDDTDAALALAGELAVRAIAAQATSARAQTLLCACLRDPETADPAGRTRALSVLLALDSAATDDDLWQLAGLMFDAERYAGRQRLAGWLAASPASERTAAAGRALHAWTQGMPAPDAEAAALMAKLDGICAQLAEQVAAQTAATERLAEHRAAMAQVAQEWLDKLPPTPPPPPPDRAAAA